MGNDFKLTGDAKYKYTKQKYRAGERKIKWEFTEETWWEVWKDRWHLRGIKPQELCMSRINDVGAYHPDNVRLISNQENGKQIRPTSTTSLSDSDVKDIIVKSIFAKNTIKSLSIEYQVGDNAIRNIINGKTRTYISRNISDYEEQIKIYLETNILEKDHPSLPS